MMMKRKVKTAHNGKMSGREYRKKYYADHRDYFMEYNHRYYRAHRESVRATQAKYRRKLRQHWETIMNMSDEDFLVTIGYRRER